MNFDRVGPRHVLSPSWRWELAERIFAGTEPPSSDAIIRSAVRFLAEASTNSRGNPECPTVTAVAAAAEIYGQLDLRQAEINARLLAGQSDQEIAERCGVAAEVIAAYAHLFLDVRGSLSAVSWLQVHVLGSGPHRGFRDHELAEWWAQQALVGGPRWLDHLISTYRAVTTPSDPLALSNYLTRSPGVDLNLKALVATCMIPPANATTTKGITDFWFELKSAQRVRRRQLGASMDDFKQCFVDAALAVFAQDGNALREVTKRIRNTRARDLRPPKPPASTAESEVSCLTSSCIHGASKVAHRQP